MSPLPSRDTLINALSGATNQSARIAEAYVNGDIGMNILGDDLFEKVYMNYGGEGEAPAAFAVGTQTYMRASSTSILSDTVHEATHALDNLDELDLGTFDSEMRAYSAEYDFQRAIGVTPDFSSKSAIAKFIQKHY
jgi:hypothetical protein